MPTTLEAENELKVGSKAPEFSMPATQIGEASSVKLKGKPFVLYFYPKDNTSGCTREACDFRDAMPSFSDLNSAIIGVSKDNLESHEKFAQQYALPFPLATDEKGDVCKKFDVLKGDIVERSTFLIDGEGIIRAIWRNVSVPRHADEVKKAIANL